MAVILREKKLNKGRISFYLDIYNDGAREYKFLKLYLIGKPKDQAERNKNKEVRRKADALRIKTENSLVDKTGINSGNILFLDYFKEMVDQRKKSPGNHANWNAVYQALMEFFNGRKVKVSEITDNDLNAIKNFLLEVYLTKSDKKLHKNTASIYYSKVKACLNQAFAERIIHDRISLRTKSIKGVETRREHLTIEELKKIEIIDCDLPLLKNAFLFSSYTGLRWSDINNLRWMDIRYNSESGYSLNYKQQKTSGIEYAPIPDKATSFIGERQEDAERVFKGLRYSTYFNRKLKEWLKKAGINRKITFHCARHTYATVLLTKNIDIYTVSKMMGHRNLKTTQIYANVIDQRKIDALKIFDSI
jgi:integrase